MTPEKEFTTRLGMEIAKTRMRKGKSREWVGIQAGIHRNTVERYEKGADIPIITFMRICVALGESSAAVLDKVLGQLGKSPK
jgi:predicted transcriptional regulator